MVSGENNLFFKIICVFNLFFLFSFRQPNSVMRELFWCTKIRISVVWAICVAGNHVTPATVEMSVTKFPSPNWKSMECSKYRPVHRCRRSKKNWKDCRICLVNRVWLARTHRKPMSIKCSVRMPISPSKTFQMIHFDFVVSFVEKRYANLCELCEDPVKCNYPDKYSGYDGAIRCLVEQNADVAFTKVIFVRRYFGVRIFAVCCMWIFFNMTNWFFSCRSIIK